MEQNINLIPEQEIKAQTKEKVLKSSTAFSLIVLFVVFLVSAFLFYQKYTLANKISALAGAIDNLRTQVQQYASIEISARNLDTKYNVIQTIFDTRSHYSVLLQKLQNQIPASISVESLTLAGVGDTKISLSGHAENYLAVADLINQLATEKALFTNVTLNSVSLDDRTNKVAFFILVSFDPKGLAK